MIEASTLPTVCIPIATAINMMNQQLISSEYTLEFIENHLKAVAKGEPEEYDQPSFCLSTGELIEEALVCSKMTS